MKTGQRGIDLIKEFEGLRLAAYRCPAGIPTIGYGHTKGVTMGDTVTKEEAENLLREDLEVFEAGVRKAVKANVTQSQFDALVSFAYNLGLGNLRSSTLLKLLNDGKYLDAANQFPRWNKAGGQVLNGLVRRRDMERALFMRNMSDLHTYMDVNSMDSKMPLPKDPGSNLNGTTACDDPEYDCDNSDNDE